jgi:1-acyl-sn-glycerol-3-phosphate acyltransferase
MPSALIQPVAIRGTWELLRYNFLPVPWGTSIEIEFLEPVEPSAYPSELLLEEVGKRIKVAVENG